MSEYNYRADGYFGGESSHVYSNREIIERVKSLGNCECSFCKAQRFVKGSALSGTKSPTEQAKAKALHQRINTRFVVRRCDNEHVFTKYWFNFIHQDFPNRHDK